MAIRGIPKRCVMAFQSCILTELRVDHGPGYRVYFTRRGPLVIVLLVGGDKRTQDADIERAIEILKNWKE